MEAIEMSSEKPRIENRTEEKQDKDKTCDEPIANDILPLENGFRKLESEKEYPSGISFILLTVGLMAVVLVLALDNYIISEFEALASSSSDREANIQSDGHTNSDHPFQQSQPSWLVWQLLFSYAHVLSACVWPNVHLFPCQDSLPGIHCRIRGWICC